MLSDTIPLTEEQFTTFLEKTITIEHSRRILDGLTEQNAATLTPKASWKAHGGIVHIESLKDAGTKVDLIFCAQNN